MENMLEIPLYTSRLSYTEKENSRNPVIRKIQDSLFV